MVFTGSFDTIGSIIYVVTLLPLDLLYCITVGVNFDTLSYFAFPLWFVQRNRDIRSLLVYFPINTYFNSILEGNGVCDAPSFVKPLLLCAPIGYNHPALLKVMTNPNNLVSSFLLSGKIKIWSRWHCSE